MAIPLPFFSKSTMRLLPFDLDPAFDKDIVNFNDLSTF
jgi:hypothetical protein